MRKKYILINILCRIIFIFKKIYYFLIFIISDFSYFMIFQLTFYYFKFNWVEINEIITKMYLIPT